MTVYIPSDIFNLNHIKKQYFNNNYLIFRNLDLRFNDFNNYEKILSNLDEKEIALSLPDKVKYLLAVS